MAPCSELPGLGHEHNEVVVIFDGGGDGSIVVTPLGFGDLAIVVLVSEVGKELKESLVFGDFSRDNLWVCVTGVANSEVGSSDGSRAISIEFVECGVNHSLSGSVQGTSKHHEELVEVHIAVLISIVVGQEEIGLLLGKVAAALIEADEELLGIDLSVTVIVDGSENSTESSDGFGSSSSHLALDFRHN